MLAAQGRNRSFTPQSSLLSSFQHLGSPSMANWWLSDSGTDLRGRAVSGLQGDLGSLPRNWTWAVDIVQSLSHVQLFVTQWIHTRISCPLLAPGVCSNSCPLSQWCHPTISSSITPFSSCPQSFLVSGSFLVSSSHQVSKVLELQLHHQSFQWIFRVDFLILILVSKGI